MKVGDLVELQKNIYHVSGLCVAGTIGILVRARPHHIEVRFADKAVWCHFEELEIISES